MQCPVGLTPTHLESYKQFVLQFSIEYNELDLSSQIPIIWVFFRELISVSAKQSFRSRKKNSTCI